jgi:hypothetical protein
VGSVVHNHKVIKSYTSPGELKYFMQFYQTKIEMNTENIVKEITPAQLRELQIRHDYLHQLIQIRENVIFISEEYRDDSCTRCNGELDIIMLYDKKYDPLRRISVEVGLTPSNKTRQLFDTLSWKIAQTRRAENIRKILYACRYAKYPGEWTPLITYFDRTLSGGVPNRIIVNYLPDMTVAEEDAIKNSLLEHLRHSAPAELWHFYQEAPASQGPSYIQPAKQLQQIAYPPNNPEKRKNNGKAREQKQKEKIAAWHQFAQQSSSTSPERTAEIHTQITQTLFGRSPLDQIRNKNNIDWNQANPRTLNYPTLEIDNDEEEIIAHNDQDKNNNQGNEENILLDNEYDAYNDDENYEQGSVVEYYNNNEDNDYMFFENNANNYDGNNEANNDGTIDENEDIDYNDENEDIDYNEENEDSDYNEENDDRVIGEPMENIDNENGETTPPAEDINTAPPPGGNLQAEQNQNPEQIIDNPIQLPQENPVENLILEEQFPPPDEDPEIMNAQQFQQLLTQMVTNLQRTEQSSRPYDITFIEGKTNPRKFIEEIERRFDANGVTNENRKLQLLRSMLSASAANWLHEETHAQQPRISNWNSANNQATALVPQFIQRYLTPSLKRKMLEEYNQLKLGRNESVEDYARKLREYWRDLQNRPNDYGQREKFIQGLPSKIKMAIYQQGEPANLEAAIGRARNAEMAMMFDDEEEKSDNQNQKMLLLIAERLEKMQQQNEDVNNKPPQVLYAERPPVSNQGRAPRNNNARNNFNNNRGNNFDNNERKCYGCGLTGHIRRQCRTRCANCGKVGHVAKNCFTKPTPKNV